MLTRDEATRCAHVAVALRPDWTIPQVMAVMDDPRVRPRPFAHVVIALAFIATDETTKGPGRLFASGDWWDACRKKPTEPRPPVFRVLAWDDCHECGGPKLGAHVGHPYTPPPTATDGPPPEVKRALTALRPPPADQEKS